MEDTNAIRSRLEAKEEIKTAAKVLKLLEKKGVKEPCIASGWVRGFLMGEEPTDVDIAFVGGVHYRTAREYLVEILDTLSLDKKFWDVKGIWNAEIAFPSIRSTEENYLAFYVNSIDCVYLAADGKLHDPTGHGIVDAQTKTLRMIDFEKNDFDYPLIELVYFCLEGCRRIAKFGWKPTERSCELIRGGVKYWEMLNQEEQRYVLKRITTKYLPSEYSSAQKIYDIYGWGFVFDQVK